MPIDRAATLHNAKKLLRQGRLDQAIAEYLRIVEDHPLDWNTANILGDLYVRVGQPDRAVEQFTRVADHLSNEGFLPKAGALYKKILKIKPDHEHALLQSAEVAASQGLLAAARSYLNAVAERRRRRGDQRGIAQITIRLGSLDSGDYEARLAAARARIAINDAQGALGDFKELAAELAEKGRQAEAIEALREAAVLSPEDEEVREQLLHVYLGAGDFARARECASTVDQLKTIAGRLEAQGYQGEALATLLEAARLDPADADLKADLARAYVAQGELPSSAQHLRVEDAGNNLQVLLAVAETELRGDRVDEAIALVVRLLDEDPSRRDAIALLGWSVAEHAPDAGFRVVDLAAEAAVAQSDWPSAAAALQEFVTRVPNHIAALMRLVEICVDGGLEATMYSAQAQLADAYIESGFAEEARFIAEDLVAREPWDRANIERFRRALVLMGEPDPDALIAQRLSGQSPFMSTDLSSDAEELPDFDVPAALEEERGAVEPLPSPPKAPPVVSKVSPAPNLRQSDHFELSANAIDVEGMLSDLEKPPTAYGRSESVEVDLSIVLDDINERPAKPAPAPPPSEPGEDDLDGVFAHLRDEASRRSALQAAEAEYKRGLALHKAGQIDECIPSLQAASRAPRLRFVTALLLGRIYRDRGMTPQAIEWFERAAEAPAPSVGEGHALLYELADALESVGEVARALAICMELQADVGDYRDVAARVDRLAKVQTRG